MTQKNQSEQGLKKFLATILLSCIWTNAFAVDWVLVGSDELGSIYYDQSAVAVYSPDSVALFFFKTNDAHLQVYILYNYLRLKNEFSPSYPYMSTVERAFYNCRTGNFIMDTRVAYPKIFANGRQISSFDQPEDDRYSKPGPLTGKIFTKLSYLCKPVSDAYKARKDSRISDVPLKDSDPNWIDLGTGYEQHVYSGRLRPWQGPYKEK